MSEMQETMSTDAQLAVLRVKIDQLIELNKTRGEDHETRLRTLEANYVSRRTVITMVVTVCTVVTAAANFLSFLVR